MTPRDGTGRLTMQVRLRTGLRTKFPASRETNREFCSILHFDFDVQSASEFNGFQPNSLRNGTGNFQTRIREILSRNREFPPGGSFVSSRHALHSSGADRCADVHFTPKVDRRAEVSLRRLCANSGCAIAAVSRRSKRSVYSITSSARARSVGGTTVP